MTFVAEATEDGGLCMRKGEFRICSGRIVRRSLTRHGADALMFVLDEDDSPGVSKSETELRLAVSGLRMRRFPCDSYHGSWRMFGTEAAV